jgi:hypothetical protein
LFEGSHSSTSGSSFGCTHKISSPSTGNESRVDLV